jgi:hypothetical protein
MLDARRRRMTIASLPTEATFVVVVAPEHLPVRLAAELPVQAALFGHLLVFRALRNSSPGHSGASVVG